MGSSEERLEESVVAIVPNNRLLVVKDQPQSFWAESFRMLRTNLIFSRSDGNLKIILFTSSGPGEGKSVTVANTAVSMAQSGKKVILVDCDLRRPMQNLIFDRASAGLTAALFEEKNVITLLQETGQANLLLLAAGTVPKNPSECLGSARMSKLLEALRPCADYIFIDCPPVLPVSDTCILASKADGVVLVLGAGQVRQEMAESAIEALRQAKGNILGVVINRIKPEFGIETYYSARRAKRIGAI